MRDGRTGIATGRGMRLLAIGIASSLVGLVFAGTSAAATTPVNGAFTGTTSQTANGDHAPLRFRIGSNGTRVKVAEFNWLVMCPDAPGEYAERPLVQATEFKNAPIVHGRFGGTSNYVSTSGGNLKSGYQVKIRFTVHGRFTSTRRAKGTLAIKASVTDPNGQHFADCSAGGVRWTASAGGH